jgi:hypothetical protein
MSRGGFGGGRGGFGGGANRSGPQQLMSFDLIKDLGVNGLFNVQTDLFPVSFQKKRFLCGKELIVAIMFLVENGCPCASQVLFE